MPAGLRCKGCDGEGLARYTWHWMPDNTSPPAPAKLVGSKMPWALLAAACLGMFAASASGTTRAPFLLEMARDLNTSLPLVANLMAITSIVWGAASMLAGAGSDRWGRRPFLIGGPIGLALAMLGHSSAGDFPTAMVWAAIAGGCAGGFTGVIMAEASARTVDRQRGRALGWVMAGQSLTLLIGIPLAAFIGQWIGWRGVNRAVAVVSLFAALCLLLTTLRPAPSMTLRPGARSGLRAALTGRVTRLLAVGVAERTCYGLVAVYFATFLQTTYHLSLAGVALPLALFAIGNILGTILGGQMADKLPSRRVNMVWGMLASAVAALPLFLWTPNLSTSLLLGFVYVFVTALPRPSLMAALARVPDAVRGTVLGLNVTSASFGWLFAASLGGWMIAGPGFAAFGPLAGGIALVGALLAFLGEPE